MKNYLFIGNNELLDIKDLTLIGISSSRGDKTKIGRFGSGLKYAMAVLMRENIDIKFNVNNSLWNIERKNESHRGIDYTKLVVNGIETSITSNMGPDWTEWMMLREILSNARDQKDFYITTMLNPDFTTTFDTGIWIETTSKISEILSDYDSYFAWDRVADFEAEGIKFYKKKEKGNIVFYRKGIRCYDNYQIEGEYDIDFDNIEINEYRVTTGDSIKESLYRFQRQCKTEIPENIIRFILNLPNTNSPGKGLLEGLKTMVERGVNFTASFIKMLGGDIAVSGSLTIPDSWYHELSQMGLLKSPFGDKGFVETKQNDLLKKKINVYLKSLGLNFDIKFGKFKSQFITVKKEGTTILISDNIMSDTPDDIAAHVLTGLYHSDWLQVLNR